MKPRCEIGNKQRKTGHAIVWALVIFIYFKEERLLKISIDESTTTSIIAEIVISKRFFRKNKIPFGRIFSTAKYTDNRYFLWIVNFAYLKSIQRR